MKDLATDHLDATARAYLDGYQNGYEDGYDHGKADAIAAQPDPGPMDEDRATVQLVRAWAPPEPLPLPAGPDYAPDPRRVARRHTPDLLREVARVYWQAGPDAPPWQRMEAVAEKYDVHRTTAGRYIRDARRAGILPPDPPPVRHRPRAQTPPPDPGPDDDEPNPW